MKTLNFSVLFIAVFSFSLYSQTANQLSIAIEKTPEKPQTVVFEFTPDNSLEEGLFIKLPVGLKYVVQSISIGDSSLWLKNSDVKESAQNTVAWSAQETGLVLSYNRDLISIPGILKIEIIPDNRKIKSLNNFTVEVHAASYDVQEWEIQEIVYASSQVSVN